MAVGDFSPSQMPKVLLIQKDIFLNGGRLNVDKNNPRVNTARAVLENQTARPVPVMTNGSCTAVDMTWLKYCDQSVVDCADGGYTFSCDITGAEGESVKQTLTPNICLEKKFSVNDDECNDAFTAEMKIAEGMINAKLAIETELSQVIAARLYAGISPASAYPGEEPPGWDLSGTPYQYPGDATKRPLTLSQMYVMSQINRITNPVLVGDGSWQADAYLAQFLNNQGGAIYNEAGLYGQWGRWYFDPIALMGLNNNVGRLLMFDPNNVILWTKNDIPSSEMSPTMWLPSKSLSRWREPSLILKDANGSPLYYDAWMQETCIEGVSGSRRKTYAFQLILRGGFNIGPNACNANDSGVYYFEQDTPTT